MKFLHAERFGCMRHSCAEFLTHLELVEPVFGTSCFGSGCRLRNGVKFEPAIIERRTSSQLAGNLKQIWDSSCNQTR